MKRKGFTLVEVLIVVIIIGILAAIGIPQFSAAMEKAKAGHGLDKATMASLSANMKKLANQASLAASMSALLAKFRK